jgi:membrane-bound ClpP family serine protease
MLIYAAIGAFGFLFLVVMLFSGLGDHELGGHDGAIGHVDAGQDGPGVFSARVMASFLTAFGVGGIVGRYYDLPHPAASAVGIVAGLVMAGAVYQFARLLYSQQASSSVQMTSLVGRSAEVSVAIPEGGVGQVALIASGERTEHVARGVDGRAIARGTEVVITALRGDSLVVVPAATPAGGSR